MAKQVARMGSASAMVDGEIKKEMKKYQFKVKQAEAQAKELAASITRTLDPKLKITFKEEAIPPVVKEEFEKECDAKKVMKAAVWGESCYEDCGWFSCDTSCSPTKKVDAVLQNCDFVRAKFKRE